MALDDPAAEVVPADGTGAPRLFAWQPPSGEADVHAGQV